MESMKYEVYSVTNRNRHIYSLRIESAQLNQIGFPKKAVF